MNPLISVIIPVYNQEKYLTETVDSVLVQTFENFELILVDDGSKDKSAQIIAEYAKKDNRIVPFYWTNAGKPDALNKAVAEAKGKYIAFMDHDDLMMPDRLQKQFTYLELNPDIHAVSCQCYFINGKGKLQGVQHYPLIKTAEACKKLVENKGIFSGAFTGLTIHKFAFIEAGGLNKQFWPTDDHEFFNRFIDTNFILVIMEDILMKYRVHESATTVSKQQHLFEMIHYTEHCIALRRNKESYISYETFRAKQKQKSWWERINMFRKDYALLYHRTAGMTLYSKNYLKFFLYFTAATVLNPHFVYATLTNKLKN